MSAVHPQAQAFGRVHRIGQTSETTLHKFLVHHTVEQNVDRLCCTRRSGATEPRSRGKGDRKGACGGGGGAGGDAKHMTIGDVAALLTTDEWDRDDTQPKQPQQQQAQAAGQS